MFSTIILSASILAIVIPFNVGILEGTIKVDRMTVNKMTVTK